MTEPSPAASVLLAREPGSPQVLMVRRGDHLRFFGGFWAFPGGKVAGDDAELPLAAPPGPPWRPHHGHRCVTAARELFEETGILIARRQGGAFPGAAELGPHRRDFLDGKVTFAEVLGRLGLAVHAADFRLIGDITTPAFTTIRFDTTFFAADCPPGQAVEIWPGELSEHAWAAAADTLDLWARGDALLSPPTAMSLEAIRRRPAAEAPGRLGPLFESLARGESIHPIFFAPDVQLIPLRTAALPPSDHTNAFLVGRSPAYLIDPGPEDPAEQARLFALLDARLAGGLDLRAVVLSHQHRDHVGAALATARRYRLPVWAHPVTAEKLRGRVPVDAFVNDGDTLPLGRRPDGSGPWHLRAVHTPGHAAGHLAFYDPFYRLIFAGDMVSTMTSIIVAPPEGDLAVYLQSLRGLEALDARLLLPAHGNVSSRPQQTIREALEHRAKRERLLVAALSPTPRAVGELTPELYKGTPAELLPLAEKQMLAGLLKLQREGRVEQVGGGWRLTATG